MNIEFKRLDEIPDKNPSIPVKVTTMGNVIETQYMSRRNNKQTIQMLPGGEQFCICSTGEIKDVEHHLARSGNKKGLYKTFAKARGIINANVTDVSRVRWCTLTYAENMTDTKQLYVDFKRFNHRFRYYCETKGYGRPEYIVMMEPQGRGAWHVHLLYIWCDQVAPYIPNEDLRRLWGHGFVRVKKLDNVDNVGAYLTAYLGDMEISDTSGVDSSLVKQVEVENDDGIKVTKAVLKGARLHLYPANFNMLRYSRGVKKPIEEMMDQKEAEKKVLAGSKTFESAVKLLDSDSGFECIVIKSQYNMIRGKNQ